MEITITDTQLEKIIKRASMHAVDTALRKAGFTQKQVKQEEAYRLYSKRRVRRWVRDSKIKPIRQGASVYFNLSELEFLSDQPDYITIKSR